MRCSAQDAYRRFPQVLEGINGDSKREIVHLLERSNELRGKPEHRLETYKLVRITSTLYASPYKIQCPGSRYSLVCNGRCSLLSADLGLIKRRVHHRICHDDMRGVEKLLKAGESIDFRDSAGGTLLHRACEEVEKELPLSFIQGPGNVTASVERVVIACSVKQSARLRSKGRELSNVKFVETQNMAFC